MERARRVTLPAGEPVSRHQHNPPWPIVKAALVAAVAVIACEQPRYTIKRNNHHDAAIASAITVNPYAGRPCRVTLDGEISQINRQIGHNGTKADGRSQHALLKQCGQSLKGPRARRRKADLKILPDTVATMLDDRRGGAKSLPACFGAEH
jgi:hypothetical protein